MTAKFELTGHLLDVNSYKLVIYGGKGENYFNSNESKPPPQKKGHEKSLTKRWNSIKQKQ